MIIKDFNRQSILSPEELADIVRALPRAHFHGLRTILYKPTNEFLKLQIPVHPGCKGAFYPEFCSIIIHDLVNKSLAPHIIYHEVGHYVFHSIIGSFLKKEWVSSIYSACPPVSAYGKKNAIEDFSEAYAFYISKPEFLLRFPAKFRFMREKVFKIN